MGRKIIGIFPLWSEKIEKREESESPCGSEESSKEWFEGEDDSTSKAYSRGQYYRVHLGDELNNNRYIVETRLGWGHFSTVWLVTMKTLTYIMFHNIFSMLRQLIGNIKILSFLKVSTLPRCSE